MNIIYILQLLLLLHINISKNHTIPLYNIHIFILLINRSFSQIIKKNSYFVLVYNILVPNKLNISINYIRQ